MSLLSDDINACAKLVQKGDPDRFMSAMTAGLNERATLFVLYAFNVEIARAPWVTKEAIIAEMRLQWWLDAIEEIYEGKTIRRHEVVTPLSEIIKENNLPRGLFDDLINARRWDIYKDPHEDNAALTAYLQKTSGILPLAHLATGGSQSNGLSDFTLGAGVASLLSAIPALENAQKYPLVDGTPEGVIGLAQQGLTALINGRKGIGRVPVQSRAALRAAWWTKPVLKKAVSNPSLVVDGHLSEPLGIKKLRLIFLSAAKLY
jgi:hypothetical protein